MNQVPFSDQNSVLRIREISGYLAHPQSLRRLCNPCDLHLPCRQVDEEQHDEPLQTSAGPHLYREEIRGHNHLPMPAQKLLPCRLPAPLRCRFHPVSFQNRRDRAASKFVAKIGQRTRDSSIALAGDLGKSFSSQRFGLYGQSPALIVIEAHSPATELFSKHPIFLAKIFNDLQLAVVHPPGDGDQQKPEWVEHSLRIQNPLSRPPSRSSEISPLHADPVFGPYAMAMWSGSLKMVARRYR